MAAIDYIKGREFKKYKLHDVEWHLSGTTIFMNGQEESGSLDWNKSRYLKTGKNNEFWAFLSGSGVTPHYKVFLDEKREGYVKPKDFGWKLPLTTSSDDDEEE